MSTDWYTKLMLTVIAASAAVFALQQFQERGAYRYQVQVIPMARTLLRVDGETGRTWTAALGRPNAWEPIEESLVETLDDTEPKPEKQPARPAPGPDALNADS